MTLVDNDPALFAFGVETYKVGPKQYWFLARDQAEQAMVPKKLPPLPAKQKVKGPPKLKTYVGGQNDPPGNDAEAAPIETLCNGASANSSEHSRSSSS